MSELSDGLRVGILLTALLPFGASAAELDVLQPAGDTLSEQLESLDHRKLITARQLEILRDLQEIAAIQRTLGGSDGPADRPAPAAAPAPAGLALPIPLYVEGIVTRPGQPDAADVRLADGRVIRVTRGNRLPDGRAVLAIEPRGIGVANSTGQPDLIPLGRTALPGDR